MSPLVIHSRAIMLVREVITVLQVRFKNQNGGMHHRHSDYASLYRNSLIFSSITQYHIWILRIIYEKIYLQYRLLRDN